MLVLMLAAVVLMLSIRQFNSYKRDNEVRQIQASVDQLFQGLAMYYQANCRNPSDSLGNPVLSGSYGTLDPSHIPPPSSPYTLLTVAVGNNSLVDSGYLSQWKPLSNSLVDASYGDNGFSVQFNNVSAATPSRTPDATFYAWVGGDSTNANTATRVTFSSSVGTIYIWQSHIAMKLASTLDPAVYKGRLGATCSSSSATTPCLSATPGSFIIWESLPSTASRSSTSSLAPFMPTVKAFTNLYYTNDMYGAMTGQASSNNYLCGG